MFLELYRYPIAKASKNIYQNPAGVLPPWRSGKLMEPAAFKGVLSAVPVLFRCEDADHRLGVETTLTFERGSLAAGVSSETKKAQTDQPWPFCPAWFG